MPISSLVLRSSATLVFVFLLLTTSTYALISNVYSLDTEYSGSSFFDGFDFWTQADPTHGFVTYVSETQAYDQGLIHATDGSPVYVGVDNSTYYDGNANYYNINGVGRPSVRLTSKKQFTHGLFIADILHMPGGTCGTWPALWTLGTGTWPDNGEIDWVEGANDQTTSLMSLHTAGQCTISGDSRSETGSLQNTNCQYDVATNGNSVGCGVSDTRTSSYGSGFNSVGGGVYAMQWTSDFIQMWFFPSGSVPTNIADGTPDPSTWGTPASYFAGNCDIDANFANHQIVIDNTFCGDWAGNTWSQSCQGKTGAPSCSAYVANNPGAFDETYWNINSIKVYQLKPQASPTSTWSTTSSTTSSTSSSTTSSTSTTSTLSSSSSISSSTSTSSSSSSTSSSTKTTTSSSSSTSSSTSSSSSASSASTTSTTSKSTSSSSTSTTYSTSSTASKTSSSSSTSSTSSTSSSTTSKGSSSSSTTTSTSTSSSSSKSSSSSTSSRTSTTSTSTATTSSSSSKSTSFSTTTQSKTSSSTTTSTSSSTWTGTWSANPSKVTYSGSGTPTFSLTTAHAQSSLQAPAMGGTLTGSWAAYPEPSGDSGWGKDGSSTSTVHTTVLTTTYVDLCPTGYTTKTATLTTTHCGCTDQPAPSVPMTTFTTVCPGGWGPATGTDPATVTLTTPWLPASTSSVVVVVSATPTAAAATTGWGSDGWSKNATTTATTPVVAAVGSSSPAAWGAGTAGASSSSYSNASATGPWVAKFTGAAPAAVNLPSPVSMAIVALVGLMAASL